MFIKLLKCIFNIEKIEFLGFIINRFGIQIDSFKLDAIAIWLIPESFQNIQIFYGMANSYCRFIEAFSRVAAGLTDMLKGGEKNKFKGMKFKKTLEAI